MFVAAIAGSIALLWVPIFMHPENDSTKRLFEVPPSHRTAAVSSSLVPPNLPGFDSTKEDPPAPLEIRVGEFVDGVPLDVREGYGTTPGPVTFAFPVSLINQGSRPLLISGYELIPLGCEYERPIRDQDGDQGFFPAPGSRDPVFLPISLPPGEAKTLFLKTGIVVSHEAYIATFELSARATLRDLLLRVLPHDVAGESGVGQDLFGNPIVYGVGNRGLFDYELNEPSTAIQPTYKLVIYFLSGGPRDVVFAPYPNARRATSDQDCPEEPFLKKPTLQLP